MVGWAGNNMCSATGGGSCVCRVGASLVSKAWWMAEAASPVQHTHVSTKSGMYGHSANLSRLRRDLRDTSRLLRLWLNSAYVHEFLTMRPRLPRLQYLKIEDLDYTTEQAGQLLHLSALRNLQVCHLLLSLGQLLHHMRLHTQH